MGHRAVVIILRCFTRSAEFRAGEGRLIRDLSCDDTPFRAPTKKGPDDASGLHV